MGTDFTLTDTGVTMKETKGNKTVINTKIIKEGNITQKIMPKKKDKKSKRWTDKRILKPTPRPTYVIESNPYRNSSFNKSWNSEVLSGWK